MKHYNIQLKDHRTGQSILGSGGVCYVATAGGSAKVALTDKDGTTVANPRVLTRGMIDFWTSDAINTVDLYGMAPNGQFFELAGVGPSGPNEIAIDRGKRQQMARIPFSIADTAAATETDTGFDLPAKCAVHPWGLGLDVITLDDTEDIDVGLLSTESGGDADGFMDAVSVATAGLKLATVGFDVGTNATFVDLTGGDVEFTYGLYMTAVGTKAAISEGSNADTDEGMYLLVDHLSDEVTAKSISYTLSAGTDTAVGFLNIPYTLLGAV